MKLLKKAGAEVLGTFVLVFFACGTAAALTAWGLWDAGAWVGTSLAFGLVIVAMAYTVGIVSGCHLNPAVSLGVFLKQVLYREKVFTWKDLLAYIGAQVLGATIGALLLFSILSGAGLGEAMIENGAWATNGVPALGETGEVLAGGYLVSIAAEIILTAIFVYVILAVCNDAKRGKSEGKAGILIGAALTLVHLVGIGLGTGTSVNPARSFGPALMRLIFDTNSEGAINQGALDAISQTWVFWVAPLAGACIAALLYWVLHKGKNASGPDPSEPELAETPGTEETK